MCIRDRNYPDITLDEVEDMVDTCNIDRITVVINKVNRISELNPQMPVQETLPGMTILPESASAPAGDGM